MVIKPSPYAVLTSSLMSKAAAGIRAFVVLVRFEQPVVVFPSLPGSGSGGRRSCRKKAERSCGVDHFRKIIKYKNNVCVDKNRRGSRCTRVAA